MEATSLSSSKIQELRARVEVLERKRFENSIRHDNPAIEIDASIRRARQSVETLATLHYSATWKFVPEHYYATSLAQRANFLDAPSIHYLCKSLLLENRKAPEDGSEDPTNPRFVLVVLQYASVLDVKKLTNTIRALRKDVKQRLDDSQFDFRIASESNNEMITGYSHNSVTPFGMKCQQKESYVPIILSKTLVPLKYFWMGGGHVHLKLGMAVSDFCHALHPILAEISRPRTSTEELVESDI